MPPSPSFARKPLLPSPACDALTPDLSRRLSRRLSILRIPSLLQHLGAKLQPML
uniref:Uncharacterized protein n=1 Tax=Oryza sativa subsp. japonica TaxID=39947 RepID=Q5VS47_ORYSJ|nr:hypothetical protein [Oryza sativa Japonica Group]